MSFRPAALRDATMLYTWRRNDELAVSYPSPTTFDAHRVWLGARIANPLVKILVWEEVGRPVGMLRIDTSGEVAFHAVDDETAVRMLRAASAYIDEYGGRLKATVDADDRKWRLLQRAGFTEYPARALVFKA